MSSYERDGILTEKDLQVPSEKHLRKGVAVIECVQRIPCNPCVSVCPVDAISMEDVNAPPIVDFNTCIGCGKCVGVCPGLAIFVVKKQNDKGLVTLPYEFLPVPKKNDKVKLLDRQGKHIGEGIVTKVISGNTTNVITVKVDSDLIMDVRNIKV